MSKLSVSFTSAIVAASSILAAGAAFAGEDVAPFNVPEPGLFGIVAAGMAGVIIAARLRNKK
jgi:hypothetical protein